MNIIRNDKLIKRNKTIGNVTTFVGIAILGAGLVLSFNPTPTKTLLSFGALIVGFVVSQISTYFVARFGRSPRYDELVADNLSKLSNDYTFYAYTAPVPMLLVGPEGLWIPVPISASGEIYYDKKWKQRGGSLFLKFFGQENLGRPELDVSAGEKEILDFLVDHLTEEELPPVNSILVMFNPKSVIGDVENAPTPLVPLDALKRKIRKFERNSEVTVSPEVLAKINEALS